MKICVGLFQSIHGKTDGGVFLFQRRNLTAQLLGGGGKGYRVTRGAKLAGELIGLGAGLGKGQL